MRRDQLEHLIRAAGDLLGEATVLVIGSQAILATVDDPEEQALMSSLEADILPLDDDDDHTKATLIDGVLGAGSQFDATHGIHADGVDRRTAILPSGWEDRLIAVSNANTNGVTGLCLEAHDLVVSKLAAGRTKDMRFARAAVGSGIVDSSVLAERVAATELSPEKRTVVEARLRQISR